MLALRSVPEAISNAVASAASLQGLYWEPQTGNPKNYNGVSGPW